MIKMHSKISALLLSILVSLTILLVSSCGGAGGDSADQSEDSRPTHNTKQDVDSEGTPLFLFGGGEPENPGEHDAAFQEYLIWKEWQQYRKYKEWLREQQGVQAEQTQTQ